MASYSQDELVIRPAGEWDRGGDVDPVADLREALAKRDIATTELRVLLEDPEDGGEARFIVEIHPVA